jgi:hypothetical protein
MKKLTTERAIRGAFWRENSGCKRSKGGQNQQCTDTRCAFVDWLDHATREGRISEALSEKVTL